MLQELDNKFWVNVDMELESLENLNKKISSGIEITKDFECNCRSVLIVLKTEVKKRIESLKEARK